MKAKLNAAFQFPIILLMSVTNMARADDGIVLREAMFLAAPSAQNPPEAPNAAVPNEFSRTLSLAQAMQLALEQNRAVLSAVLDRGLQQQDLTLAEAEFAPKFFLSGQTNRNIAGINVNSGTLSSESNIRFASGGQLALSLAQTSDDAGARSLTSALKLVQPLLKGNASVATLALQGARLTETIGRLQYEQLLNDTVANVVIAYCDARQAEVQVDFALQALLRNREIQAVNTALFQAGRLARQDLLQFDVDIAQSELNLAQARNTAEQVKRSLLQLFGPIGARTPVSALRLADALPSPANATMTESAALTLAFGNREDIKVATLALNLARFGLSRAENDLLPQVDLVAGVDRTGSMVNGIANRAGPSYTMGVTFNIPIDDKASRLVRSRAQVDLKKAEWMLEDLRLDVKNQVTSSLRDVHFAERQLVLATRSLQLSQKRLDNELEKLKAGRTSTFQLSAAQDSLKQAQVAWGVAQLAVPRAQLQLHRVTSQVQQQWIPNDLQRPPL